MKRSARLDYSVAARALAWSFLSNVVVGSGIGLGWFTPAVHDRGVLAALFAWGALVSSVALLAVLPLLALFLVALFVRASAWLGWIASIAWTTFLVALYADTVIYGLFRYHFNGMVWNVLTTPGAEDAVILSAGTLWTAGIGALVLLLLQRWAWSRFFVADVRRGTFMRSKKGGALKASMTALLGIVVLEKATFAWADLARERNVTALAGLFPLYQRFTVEKLAGKVFGMDLAARPEVDITGGGILLDYPLERPRIDPKGPRPNVLLLVVDSLRADMLAPETMPKLVEFSSRARVFENHLSGGNATRYGIFSMIYGLHGAYWKSVLEEHAPPVLVTTLQEQGYDLRVLSAPSQSYPEFRSTCWVTIEDKVEDKLVDARGAKDKMAAKLDGEREVVLRFQAWMEARKASAEKPPFFAFALLDAPHGSYAWPRDEGTWFEPVAESVDYLKLARSPAREEIEPVWNMFRNAVRWSDSNVAAMLSALERAGELENTLVIVTGDHGEEFFEHGYFGHTSNFTAVQTHVAFVMSGPGVAPGREPRPTSHLDIAPTILELLGADPAVRERWCTGANLLAPPATRTRALASWDELALWIDGEKGPIGILRVPIEGHRGLIEAYDANWIRHPDEDAFVREHSAAVARLALECRRFLR